MHLKDGTPARPGDIIKAKSGTTGLIVGGTAGSTTCNLTILVFQDAAANYGSGTVFAGAIRDAENKVVERVAIGITSQSCITASECERIGHIDVGNG